MNVITAHSTQSKIADAVRELQEQLKGCQAKLVVFFASSEYEPQAIAQQMQAAFPNAQTIGCSTAGEIVTGKVLKQSIVAMALNGEIVDDLAINIVENIKGNEASVRPALNSFASHFQVPLSELDYRKYVGIVLMDGLSTSEEKIMDHLGDATNAIFIGGSAGDDLKFTSTYVYANGKAYTNAALLALMKSTRGFDFIKTQSFRPLAKRLTVTKVNEATREVFEFDGKPAVQAYAEAVGTSVEKVADCFMANPLGIVIDGEPYVRSPQQVKDNTMVFYCSMMEGMELSVLESTDIIQDTEKAIADKKNELGNIAGIINFNCILRALELEQRGLSDTYGEIFSKVPTVGFSTYGEAYLGHINQTATMLVFK